MRPSERLFLDRDVVYRRPRARQRAKWLYDYVARQVASSEELTGLMEQPPQAKPFPPWSPLPSHRSTKVDIEPQEWRIVAEVAEYYPRLLVWLTEGQVGGVWNVFGLWFSAFRLIPGVRWLLWRFLFKRVADVAPWRVALYASVLQSERSKLNGTGAGARQGRSRRPGTGLSALTGEAVVMPTRVRSDLHDRIVGMSSGSIGISGLRGAGKSALIQDFCAHRYGTPREANLEPPKHFLPGLRIMVQAPLEFDAREFLIYQYSCLCQAVLADVRFNPTTIDRQLVALFTPVRVRFGALFGALSSAIFFAACAVLIYRVAVGGWPNPFADLFGWEIAGAVVAFLAGVAAIGWRTGRAASEIHQVINLASDAESRLRRLHYQRSDSSSLGGTVSAPLGVGVSVGTSHAFTQQLMSLPELIEDYRDFVQRVVGGLEQAEHRRSLAANAGQNWSVRLVIGIDQMDQIEDPRAACRFLEELSVQFGVPNCVYLLAVSAATMTAVDQRMVPLKTSSGGLFDEMIWVEPLGLTKSSDLLNERVVGLEPVLTTLCYVLSGGLPRELLRVARSVVRAIQRREEITGHPGGTGSADRAHAVNTVIREEVRALKHRALASAAAHGASGTLGLLERRLTDDAWPWNDCDPDAGQVIRAILESVPSLAALEQAGPPPAAADEAKAGAFAAEVCNSLMAGSYFLFTVRQLFAGNNKAVAVLSHSLTAKEEREELRRQGREMPAEGQPGVLSDLARARIALGISPDLAADLVSAARTALRGELRGEELADEDRHENLRAPVDVRFLNRPAKSAATRSAEAAAAQPAPDRLHE